MASLVIHCVWFFFLPVVFSLCSYAFIIIIIIVVVVVVTIITYHHNYVTFFNPTIEVVTFHLRGWCILGVFLLSAFTRLGHECQDLLSPCHGMHVRRLDLGLYPHPKEVFLGNGVRTHVYSKGKIPSTRIPEEDRTHDAASGRAASPTHDRLLTYLLMPIAPSGA